MQPRKPSDVSTEQMFETALRHKGNLVTAAAELGLSNRSVIWTRLNRAGMIAKLRESTGQTHVGSKKENIKIKEQANSAEIEYLGDQIHTAEELLAKSGINMDLYEVERITVNNWEVAGAKKQTDGIWKTGLRQIKVSLRRKRDETISLERLLQDLKSNSPIAKAYDYPKPLAQTYRRALEVSIMDPHFGMQCYQGESDHDWNLEICSNICMWAIDSLIKRAEGYGQFEEIVFPFGNDFLHHDNMMHTTTKGTIQPEAMAFQYVYEHAIRLAVTMVDRLAQIAPVRVIQVSGNHDYVASFSLGHVLKAYYRNNENVSVEVNPSPYKFYKFGANLIGFDHGHHIKAGKLAGLMAQHCREHWATTSFREWHLGDQHRKGTGSPVVMEEQGVSVEYLPALTPPNGWHKLKGFNWQQRGAMGFVWDHDEGPIARLQVNLDSYTGKPMGT